MGILIMKETLISLIKKGVRLSVAQDKLIVDGNISSIDPETKLFIKDNRDAIIRFILDRDKTSQQRIPKRDQSQPAPLSYSQQRLWFLDQLNGGSSQYNMSAPYRICGTPNLEVVQQAIDTIVARHEVLRTLYLQDEQGIALQQIQAAGRVDIQKLDFSACEEQEQLTRVRHFALEETQKPFDLAKNWPIRVSLIRLAEQEHVLVITMHHIASDGWSAAVLTNEFTALYVAYLQGMPCPLPALPVQYADYAAWQRKQLTASQLEQKIGYWTDLLADLPTLHSLPLDKPRAKVKSDTGAMYPQHLDKTLLFRLNKVCKEQDVTLFMLLQAGFALLLSRFSLESDIVIGSPVANRPQHELAPLIGFFANTLVFRHDLSGSPLFSEFLQKVKEQALNAYEHQDVPFDMLVDRLYPQRTLSYSPLFQIMFILQNNQSASLELPGLTLSPLTYEQALARFDLSLSMEEGEDGLQANWSFSSDLFEWQTVDCMARSFETLLQSIVDGVHQPVDRLKLVPQEDRARLEQWNQTTQEIPEGLTVKQCFEQQVLRSSLQTAVISEGQELNYLQLNEQANRVANFILAQGLGQDDFVAVCLPRGLELVIAMLGVIKAGACYQPLDPGFPDARLLYMMEDSSSELLLTDATNAIRFSSQTNAVEIRQILSGQQAELSNPAVDPQSDSLAYVVYTSGSTGRPKGVMIEHGSLSNFLYWFEQLCPLNESDTSLLKAVNSVDVSIWEILRPLCAGARLVIAKPEGQKDPVYLQQLISTYSITNLHLIPGMLNALLDAMDWQQCKSLRFVSCGGEPLSADTANRFYSSCSEARLYNFFGLSEATIDVCAFACSDPMPDKAVPIGLPVSNTRLHLLSNSGQIQPVGAIGELFIGGLSLARGYVNLADLTAERFVTLSIDGGAPEALYRTGDLVRRRADGHLVYIGRADQQVKIRGFRVELQDIEVALKALPSVKTAVVTANLTENGTTSLAAYVVPDEMDTESLDKEHFRQQIKDLLSEQLPVHMLPGHYHVLDALPLTPNGKVDRRALPALEHESPQSYAAPRTEVEMQLCELWQQLLGRERVGVTDNFFSLGGDSILSIQLVSRAARLGLKMSVRHLFDHQTIGELSRHVVQERGVVVSQEAVSGQQVLLPMQRRFLQGEATEQWHYNQSVLLAVPEGMEVAQLRTIVTGLYQRHDALRLRFSEAEGVWQGRYDAISPALIEQSLGELLLNGQSQSEWEAELGRQGGEIQRQLSLSDGPLFRAVLMRGEAGRNRLLLVIHHLLVDGLSWRVLLQDVATGYAQSSRAEQVRLDGKSSSLQQWGQFLEAYAHSAELGAEREYWLSQLQTPVEELEAQFSREADRSLASTEQVLVSLDAEQTAALLSDCHSAYHTQINDVLLSAVLLGLRHWAGLSSVQIDLEGHGREDLSAQLDLSETLGWFTSLYPVVLQCVGEGALGETLKGVKEALRRVPHKGLGYGVLRYMAEDDAICAAERRGSVLFNYLGQFDQSLDEESGVYPTGEFAGWTESPARQRQYLLSINGMVVEGCLRMSLDYNRHSYSSGSMELLATEIMAALQALISHCSEPGAGSYTPSDFPLAVMSQAELDEWQGDYPHLTRIYPSTPMQRGLLFHSELSRSAYVTQIAMDIVSGMDVGKFKQACQAVVARHEIFRTAFVGEHRHQLVLDEVLLNWFEADWTAEPDRAEAMYCAHRELDKQRGFEATEAPLMRVSLLRLSGGIYRFLWSSHHALLDGWSLSRVMGEILQSYEALVAGRAAELPAAAAYEDYIRWLAVQDKAKAQAYWREALQGVTEVTRLGGLEKVGGQGSAGENRSQNVQLNAERSGRLQQLAQQHKVTLNTVMQSAWAYLLYRYSGERRVVFGETIAGRPGDLPGVEQMAGLFINSVPVSVDVGEASSLGSWLEQMHRSGIERSEYGYLSLADIQQMSGLGHGQSLFDSLVVFENYPMDAAIQARPKGEGLQVENLQNEEQTHYGLTLVVVPGTEIGIVLHYNAGRYGDEDMTRLLGHYGRILDGMAAEPAGEVRALPMMTEPELQKIATWQAGLLNVSDDRGLWSLFVEQVDNRKEQIAVAHDGLHISYQALYQRAEQIAACLLHNGVRQGDTVGICLPRTPDLIASLLAVVRIGCAYIPLDPNYPQQQLTQMVNNSQVTLIVTISSLQEKMAFAHPVLLDNSLRDLMLPCDAAPDVDAHQLAYVMYTSGSTGVPKGVRVLHKGIIRLVKNNNFMQLDENTVFLQAASVSFDAATLEIWGSLLNGGRLVLYPEDRIDLETMNRVIEEEKVNSLWLTAGLFEQWSHKLPQTRYLRWILAGGDVLDPKSVARVYASYKDVICINGYGPTENTTFTACYPIPRDFDDYQTIPLGRYIAGTWGEVRQTDGFRAGIGMLGELWVAGAGVADGYHNNPQLSEQMFVRDRDGQVFYKTGDLVSYNAQGLLNFFGRSDEQIKIRGFRLELGAILHQLLCHPALQYGTLVVLGQGALKQLVAYVVAKPTNNLDDAALSRELRAWLQTRLPAYMLPQHYVFLDTLPLTANGKVNRQALPPLDVSTLLAHEYVAPATETEAHLCAMWKTLLQLEQVGIRDNFFELGGHSLLATRLKSQIQHDFQLEIPIQELFRLHTVQELGRYIDTENKLNKGLDLSDSILMQGQTNEESETWEL
jgi:amino acid adenylation domain-containing protein/non-ribosomal peptide synthase protein (TIGR01720 family)